MEKRIHRLAPEATQMEQISRQYHTRYNGAPRKMGRVIETYLGCDGKVRVVLVKTSSGVYKRSINKVCVVPLEKLN